MTLKLTGIFVAAIATDLFVLPALFSFRDSFLSLLILILPLLYFGTDKKYIFCGLFFSVVSEMIRGLDLGSLMLAFLFTALVIYLVQAFVDTRYTYTTRFKASRLILTALLAVMLVHTFSIFYNWKIDLLHFRIMPNLIIFIEAAGLATLFNWVFDKRKYFDVY